MNNYENMSYSAKRGIDLQADLIAVLARDLIRRNGGQEIKIVPDEFEIKDLQKRKRMVDGMDYFKLKTDKEFDTFWKKYDAAHGNDDKKKGAKKNG